MIPALIFAGWLALLAAGLVVVRWVLAARTRSTVALDVDEAHVKVNALSQRVDKLEARVREHDSALVSPGRRRA